MKRVFAILVVCLMGAACALSLDPQSAERYQREAEYYQHQADGYASDAEYYLRQAKSYESDAAYYLRNKKYDRARDYYRRAADAMDTYQDKLASARNSASRAEDYLKRAADAMR